MMKSRTRTLLFGKQKIKPTWSRTYPQKGNARPPVLLEGLSRWQPKSKDRYWIWNTRRFDLKPTDTIHFYTNGGIHTLCGKHLFGKVDFTTSRRGVFTTNSPAHVNCLLCKGKLK